MGHRLHTVIETFAVVALAAEIHAQLGTTSAGFEFGYAAARAVFVRKYDGAYRTVPEARPLTHWLVGSSASAPTR